MRLQPTCQQDPVATRPTRRLRHLQPADHGRPGRGEHAVSLSLMTGSIHPVTGKPSLPDGGLRRGSRGEVVRWLQRRLNKIAGPRGHGALEGKQLAIDGVFGANTEKVVKSFQAHWKLVDDGV